jgi:hypothetical protein
MRRRRLLPYLKVGSKFQPGSGSVEIPLAEGFCVGELWESLRVKSWNDIGEKLMSA